MGLYKGTIFFHSSWPEDQLQCNVIFRVICPSHFTQEECLDEARRVFYHKYARRFANTDLGNWASCSCRVETLIEGNQEPING